MKKSIFSWWAGLVLICSGLVLFIFTNILLFGGVCFYENNPYILAVEWVASAFIFGVSCFVVWKVLVRRGFEVRIVKRKN